MGFSFGYNRAENLKDYRSARELILILTDLVSRGGNLLLDIGPTADGRIPVIMEERLTQMGAWLKVNGEAIYGTRPWRRTRQWSAGKIPQLNTGQFMTKYEIENFVKRSTPGQAVIESFFTAKGSDVYAIVPGWPGARLTLKDISLPAGASVSLLGVPGVLRWKAAGANIDVELPNLPPDAATAQYAYVIKLPGAR
jgi:alpha-L-fucosidase